MLKKLWLEETGQGMTEYGLVLGIIAVAALASILTLQEEIAEMINRAVSIVSQGNDAAS
ncbi:hypothetical protein GCM10008967_33540 [Bacillus carboniphilus]|uniref:Flp family type IVb pilin n=1 Tax=Bacillus carboniphilus TaxID=86663 RepID=A0ABN0WKP9_9BACI